MEAMSKYVRLTKGLYDKGRLVNPDKIQEMITHDADYYMSTYTYNDEHVTYYKNNNNSIAGLKDLKTNKIWFDFDDENHPENAQADTKELVTRLLNDGIPEDAIDIFFSGNKGFTVEVSTDQELTRKQVENVTLKVYGNGLKTLDKSMYDYSQVFRIPNTKHQTTGLYKIQLSIKQLNNSTIETIKEKAREVRPIKPRAKANLPEKHLKVVEKKENKVSSTTVDFTNKPRHWRDYKWAIAQGQFESGERHHALMVLAATCRGLGYDRDLALAMCTVAAEKQAARTNTDVFDLNELEKDIIDGSVYSAKWQGGQYSPESDAWLSEYCERMGFDVKKADKSSTVEITEAFDLFKNYAQNIDDLTIQTGIKALDRKLRMTVGMSVGILAGPGVGKTSLSLQILNNMSKQGHLSIFFSYDMFHALVTQKLIQKHFQIDGDEIFRRYREGDSEFQKQVMDVLREEYSNVRFCFEAGQTLSQIEETIKRTEEETGRKVKLVVVDYNELVIVDQNDATAASAVVAQNLRRIANVYNLCAVSLLQPSKMTGTPADEITSYRSAKGSSALEQSLSIMIGMSRPGFDPRHPEDDRFMNINCLKNRMGKIFALDLFWDGVTGMVRDLTSEEKSHLDSVRQRKRDEEAGDDEW